MSDVEYSNGDGNWVRLKMSGPDYPYKRTIYPFDKAEPQWIKTLYDESTSRGCVIEYSSDGGFSWQRLRESYDDVARIYSMVQRNYLARAIKYESSAGSVNMTVAGPRTIQFNPQGADQSKPPLKPMVNYANVYEKDGLYYWEETTGVPGPNCVSRIRRQTNFSFKEENTNEIVWTKWTGTVENKEQADKAIPTTATLADFGFIFTIAEPTLKSSLGYIEDSPEGRQWQFKGDAVYWIESPRLFDAEMRAALVGIPVINRIGKHVVTNNKVGSGFYIHKSNLKRFVTAVEAIGGYVSMDRGKSGDTERIMEYAETLEKKLNAGVTTDELAEAITEAIAYRDACIAALQQLNGQISEAKKRMEKAAFDEINSQYQGTARRN